MSPRKLYAPHLNKVKVSLDQGMDQIDWTCQEWQEFTDSCLAEVDIGQYPLQLAKLININYAGGHLQGPHQQGQRHLLQQGGEAPGQHCKC